MKKSKFLLLGSLSSLATIPFVAAKCGDTKEEEKKPAEMPGGGQTDSTPSTSTTVNLGNLKKDVQEKINKLAKDGVKKEEVLAVLKTVEGLKDLTEEDLKTVEFKNKKLVIEAKEGSKLVSGKYEFAAQTDSNSSTSTTVNLGNLKKDAQEKINKLAKDGVKKEEVLAVLKTVEGLKDLTEEDLKTVESKNKKLVIEAKEGSKLVSGKYEFAAQTDSNSSTSTTVNLGNLKKDVQEKINKLAKDGVKKEEVLAVLKTVEGLKDLTEEDLKTVEFKNKKLVIEAKEGSKLVSGKYEFTTERMANNTDASGAEIGLRTR
ncbi:variable surface lipoprotein [Mycoplasmopsis agalactiae]|uniref:variable surface lipoprotein n=1 Tax=Mycoplasmopsis agalactiae TaxID=2110 RepID=UPI00211BFAD2|nr:variable surface lipoprotein [Mycoplasmopsis agalactiae]UUM25493.1 variable surface lipoprotein [Mycoplasmopsis agalactiae]